MLPLDVKTMEVEAGERPRKAKAPPVREKAVTSFKFRLCMYFGIIWLMLLLVLVIGLRTGAGETVGWAMQIPLLLFAIFVSSSHPQDGCLPHDGKARPVGPTRKDKKIVIPKKPRLVWIDHLKVFLILSVVVGNAAIAFTGYGAGIGFPGTHKGHSEGSFWNTCVLVALLLAKPVVVPLLFCIAGYLAPLSLDADGPFKFVRNRFVRLGCPFLVFWLVLNPLMYTHCYTLIKPTYNDTDASDWQNTEWKSAKYEYFPSSPHTWFLLWLLVFQCGYASLDGPPLLLDKIPPFGHMALGLLGVAGLQVAAAVCCIVGGSTLGLAEMPMSSPGDGFFNLFGFVAGVVSQRNGWFENGLPAGLVTQCRYYVGITVSIVVLVMIAVSGLLFHSNFVVDVTLVILKFPLAPYTFAMGVVIVDTFQKGTNAENPLMKYLSNGAFMVYLTHYWILNVFTYSWIYILYDTHDYQNRITFTKGSLVADQHLGDADCFGGLFYTSILTIIVCYAFSSFLEYARFKCIPTEVGTNVVLQQKS